MKIKKIFSVILLNLFLINTFSASVTYAADQVLTAPSPSFIENETQPDASFTMNRMLLWVNTENSQNTYIKQYLTLDEDNVGGFIFNLWRTAELNISETPETIKVELYEEDNTWVTTLLSEKLFDWTYSIEPTEFKWIFPSNQAIDKTKKIFLKIYINSQNTGIDFPYYLYGTEEVVEKPLYFSNLVYFDWFKENTTNSLLNLSIVRTDSDELDISTNSKYKYSQLLSDNNYLIDLSDIKVLSTSSWINQSNLDTKCSTLDGSEKNIYRPITSTEVEDLFKYSEYVWDLIDSINDVTFSNSSLVTDTFIYHFDWYSKEDLKNYKVYSHKDKNLYGDSFTFCVYNGSADISWDTKEIELNDNDNLALTWLEYNTEKYLTNKSWVVDVFKLDISNGVLNINDNTIQWNILNTWLNVWPWYAIRAVWEISVDNTWYNNADWYINTNGKYVSSLYYKVWNWNWRHSWIFSEIENEYWELSFIIADSDTSLLNNEWNLNIIIQAPITTNSIRDNVVYSRLNRNIDKYKIFVDKTDETETIDENIFTSDFINIDKKTVNWLKHLYEESYSNIEWVSNIAYDGKYYYSIKNNKLIKIWSGFNGTIKWEILETTLSVNFWTDVKTIVYLNWFLYVWYSENGLSNYITRISVKNNTVENIKITESVLSSELWDINNKKIDNSNYLYSTDWNYLYNISFLLWDEVNANNENIDKGLLIRVFDPNKWFSIIKESYILPVLDNQWNIIEKISYYTEWFFVDRDYIYVLQKDTTSDYWNVVIINKHTLEYENKIEIRQSFTNCNTPSWNTEATIYACPVNWIYDYINDRIILIDGSSNSTKIHYYDKEENNLVKYNINDIVDLDKDTKLTKFKIHYDYLLSNLELVHSYIEEFAWELVDTDKNIINGIKLSNNNISAFISEDTRYISDNSFAWEYNASILKLYRNEWNSIDIRKDNSWINTSILNINWNIQSWDYNNWAVFRTKWNQVIIGWVRDDNLVVPVLIYELWENDDFVTWKLLLRNETNIDITYSNIELLIWLNWDYDYLDNFWNTKNNILSNATKYVSVNDNNTDDWLFFAIPENDNQKIGVSSGTPNNVRFLFNNIDVPWNKIVEYTFYIGSKKDTDINKNYYQNIINSNWLYNEFKWSFNWLENIINSQKEELKENITKSEENIATPNASNPEYTYPSNNYIYEAPIYTDHNYMPVRYIRSSVNSTMWTELQAIEDTTWVNRAQWKPAYWVNGIPLYRANYVTDWSTYRKKYAYTSWSWIKTIEVNLWAVYNISTIRLAHYTRYYPTYSHVKIEWSVDQISWHTIFDSEVEWRYQEAYNSYKSFNVTSKTKTGWSDNIEYNDKKGTHFLFPWFDMVTNTALTKKVWWMVHVLPFEDDTIIEVKKIDKDTWDYNWDPQYYHIENMWDNFVFGVNSNYNYELTSNKNVTLTLDSYYLDLNKNWSLWDSSEIWSMYDVQMWKEMLIYLPWVDDKKGNLYITHAEDVDVTVNVADITNWKTNYNLVLTSWIPTKALNNIWEWQVLKIESSHPITVYYWLNENAWYNQFISPDPSRYNIPMVWTTGKKLNFESLTDENLTVIKNWTTELFNDVTYNWEANVYNISWSWASVYSDYVWKLFIGNPSQSFNFRTNLYSNTNFVWIWNSYDVLNIWTSEIEVISDENDRIRLQLWRKKRLYELDHYKNQIVWHPLWFSFINAGGYIFATWYNWMWNLWTWDSVSRYEYELIPPSFFNNEKVTKIFLNSVWDNYTWGWVFFKTESWNLYGTGMTWSNGAYNRWDRYKQPVQPNKPTLIPLSKFWNSPVEDIIYWKWHLKYFRTEAGNVYVTWVEEQEESSLRCDWQYVSDDYYDWYYQADRWFNPLRISISNVDKVAVTWNTHDVLFKVWSNAYFCWYETNLYYWNCRTGSRYREYRTPTLLPYNTWMVQDVYTSGSCYGWTALPEVDEELPDPFTIPVSNWHLMVDDNWEIFWKSYNYQGWLWVIDNQTDEWDQYFRFQWLLPSNPQFYDINNSIISPESITSWIYKFADDIRIDKITWVYSGVSYTIRSWTLYFQKLTNPEAWEEPLFTGRYLKITTKWDYYKRMYLKELIALDLEWNNLLSWLTPISATHWWLSSNITDGNTWTYSYASLWWANAEIVFDLGEEKEIYSVTWNLNQNGTYRRYQLAWIWIYSSTNWTSWTTRYSNYPYSMASSRYAPNYGTIDWTVNYSWQSYWIFSLSNFVWTSGYYTTNSTWTFPLERYMAEYKPISYKWYSLKDFNPTYRYVRFMADAWTSSFTIRNFYWRMNWTTSRSQSISNYKNVEWDNWYLKYNSSSAIASLNNITRYDTHWYIEVWATNNSNPYWFIIDLWANYNFKDTYGWYNRDISKPWKVYISNDKINWIQVWSHGGWYSSASPTTIESIIINNSWTYDLWTILPTVWWKPSIILDTPWDILMEEFWLEPMQSYIYTLWNDYVYNIKEIETIPWVYSGNNNFHVYYWNWDAWNRNTFTTVLKSRYDDQLPDNVIKTGFANKYVKYNVIWDFDFIQNNPKEVWEIDLSTSYYNTDTNILNWIPQEITLEDGESIIFTGLYWLDEDNNTDLLIDNVDNSRYTNGIIYPSNNISEDISIRKNYGSLLFKELSDINYEYIWGWFKNTSWTTQTYQIIIDEDNIDYNWANPIYKIYDNTTKLPSSDWEDVWNYISSDWNQYIINPNVYGYISKRNIGTNFDFWFDNSTLKVSTGSVSTTNITDTYTIPLVNNPEANVLDSFDINKSTFLSFKEELLSGTANKWMLCLNIENNIWDIRTICYNNDLANWYNLSNSFNNRAVVKNYSLLNKYVYQDYKSLFSDNTSPIRIISLSFTWLLDNYEVQYNDISINNYTDSNSQIAYSSNQNIYTELAPLSHSIDIWELSPTDYKEVRYIRNTLTWNDKDCNNTWVEIEALENGTNTNIAFWKLATLVWTADLPTYVKRITDWTKSSSYFADSWCSTDTLQLDLWNVYNISKINVWHKFSDGRKYTNNIVKVSKDWINWEDIYNSNLDWVYAETSGWKLLKLTNVDTSNIDNDINILSTWNKTPFIKNINKYWTKDNESIYEIYNLFLKKWINNSIIKDISTLENVYSMLWYKWENSNWYTINSSLTSEMKGYNYTDTPNYSNISWDIDEKLTFNNETSIEGYTGLWYDLWNYLEWSKRFYIEYKTLFEWDSWWGISLWNIWLDINSNRIGFRWPELYNSKITKNEWQNVKIELTSNISSHWKYITTIYVNNNPIISYDYDESDISSLRYFSIRWPFDISNDNTYYKDIKIYNKSLDAEKFNITTSYIQDNNIINFSNWETVTNDNIIVWKTNIINKGNTGISKIRYIRDWLNWSDISSSNIWNEIEVIEQWTGNNLASWIIPTSNLSLTNPASNITDWNNVSGWWTANANSLQYMLFDLWENYDVDTLNVKHYYSDNRIFKYSKTEVSEDGINWYILHDSSIDWTYVEQSEWRNYKVRNARKFEGQNNIKYVKVNMNGNNVNAWNHLVELQVEDTVTWENIALWNTNFNITPTNISNSTDWNTIYSNFSEFASGNQEIILDLGKIYSVDNVKLWLYYNDNSTWRYYKDKKVSVSIDWINWYELYNSNIDWDQIETSIWYKYDTLYTKENIQLWLNWVLMINEYPKYINTKDRTSGCQDINWVYPNFENPYIIKNSCSFNLYLKAWSNVLEFASFNVKDNSNRNVWLFKDKIFNNTNTYYGTTNKELLTYNYDDDKVLNINNFSTFNQNLSNIAMSGWKLEIWETGQTRTYITNEIFDKDYSILKSPSLEISDTYKTNYKWDLTKIMEYWDIEPELNKEWIRYIRDWLDWNNINSWNHWVEIKAIEKSTRINRALGVTPTSNLNWFTNSISIITDWLSNDSYYWSGVENPAGVDQYVEIDLGNLYNIEEIWVWHYYEGLRQYKWTKTEVSKDWINWYELYNSANKWKYIENEEWRQYYLDGIRFNSNREDNGNISNIVNPNELSTPITIDFKETIWLDKWDVIETFIKFDNKPTEFNINFKTITNENYNLYFSDDNSISKIKSYVKYIRDWTKWSNRNCSNHFVEIEAIEKITWNNVALWKTIIPNRIYNSTSSLTTAVDWDKDTSNFTLLECVESYSDWANLKIDLWDYYNLDNINVWHSYYDTLWWKTYLKTKTEVSLDGKMWNSIFDSNIDWTYIEPLDWTWISHSINNKENWNTIKYAWNLEDIEADIYYRLLIPVSWNWFENSEIQKLSFETLWSNIEIWDINVLRNYETKIWNNFKISFDLDVLTETNKSDITFWITNNSDILDKSWYKVIFSKNNISTEIYKNGVLLDSIISEEAVIKDGIDKYQLLLTKRWNNIYFATKYKYSEDWVQKTKISQVLSVEDTELLNLYNSKLIFKSNNNKFKVSNIVVWDWEDKDLYTYVKVRGVVDNLSSWILTLKNDLGEASTKFFTLYSWLDENYIYIWDMIAFRWNITDIILQPNVTADYNLFNIEYIELVKPSDIPSVISSNDDTELLWQALINKDNTVYQSFLNTKDFIMWFKISIAKTITWDQIEWMTLKMYEGNPDGTIKLDWLWQKILVAEKDISTSTVNIYPQKSSIKVLFPPVAVLDNTNYIIELSSNNENWLYIFWTNIETYTEGYSYIDKKDNTYKESFEFNTLWNTVYWEKWTLWYLGTTVWSSDKPIREIISWDNLKIISNTSNNWVVTIPHSNNLNMLYQWTILLKWDFTSSNSSWSSIILTKEWWDVDGDFTNDRAYQLEIEPNSNLLKTMLLTYGWNIETCSSLSPINNPDTEIAITFNTQAWDIRIYINWVLDNTCNMSSWSLNRPIQMKENNLTIFWNHNNWSETEMEIDFIKFYDNQLKASEISNLYNSDTGKNSYRLPYDISFYMISKDADLETIEERTYDVWVWIIKEVDWDLILEWYDAWDGVKRLILKWNATFRVKWDIIINANEVLVINDNSKFWEDSISYIWFISDNDIIVAANTKLIQGWFFARNAIKMELSDVQLYVNGLLSWNEVDTQNRTFMKEDELCSTDNPDACSVVIEFDKRLYQKMPPLFYQSNNKDGFEIKEE